MVASHMTRLLYVYLDLNFINKNKSWLVRQNPEVGKTNSKTYIYIFFETSERGKNTFNTSSNVGNEDSMRFRVNKSTEKNRAWLTKVTRATDQGAGELEALHLHLSHWISLFEHQQTEFSKYHLQRVKCVKRCLNCFQASCHSQIFYS